MSNTSPFLQIEASYAPLRTIPLPFFWTIEFIYKNNPKPAYMLLQIKVSPYYRTSESHCFPNMITIFKHNRRVWEEGEGEGEKENKTCEFQKNPFPPILLLTSKEVGRFHLCLTAAISFPFSFSLFFHVLVFFLPARRI